MLRMELAPGGLQRLRLTLTRGDLLGCNVLPGFISLSRPSCAMIVLSTHLSNKKRNPYENRITHRSIIRRDDLRDGSNFAAVNITRRCGKYRYCASHHLGHARRVNRRMDRREFRQTRRAVRRGATID